MLLFVAESFNVFLTGRTGDSAGVYGIHRQPVVGSAEVPAAVTGVPSWGCVTSFVGSAPSAKPQATRHKSIIDIPIKFLILFILSDPFILVIIRN